jgi:ubiquinone/menaquinone biosynthesis C-methylase UbiE
LYQQNNPEFMEPALQRRVQRYGWDRASVYYEASWQNQLRPAQEKLLELAHIQPGEKVIDIACGTGLVTFPSAEKVGENGVVLGTDISDKMVEQSIFIAKEKRLKHIKFERMDAEELNVEDETFDAALCALGLMYFPYPVKAMQEMLRVLKPGGRAVAAVWGKRNNCGWADIFEIVDQRVTSEVCPMFFHLGNADMLKQCFETSGFRNVTFERIKSTLEYASDEEACMAAFAGGPVALAYNKFAPQVKEEAHAEYVKSIEPFKEGGGYKIPGEFVIAIGYK